MTVEQLEAEFASRGIVRGGQLLLPAALTGGTCPLYPAGVFDLIYAAG